MMRWFYTLLMLFCVPYSLTAATKALIHMQTDRDMDEVRPQTDRLGFHILVKGADGKPIEAAQLHVRLQAPPTPWLASTDFPVVEGSTLFDADLLVEKDGYTFHIVPPIRGSYTLTAEAKPLPGDSSFVASRQEWQTEIKENPQKKTNLAILLAILIAVGSISGFVLGRTAGAAAVLFILMAGLLPQAGQAHEHKSHAPHAADAMSQVNQDGAQVKLEIHGTPRVGDLTSISARYLNAQGQLQPARFRLHFTQLEHDIEVFSTEAVARGGIFHWQGQFYDGSDHRVSVEAIPIDAAFTKGLTARSEQIVGVEAIAPPRRAVAKSFGFLMAVTALAMALGIGLGRRFNKKADGFL